MTIDFNLRGLHRDRGTRDQRLYFKSKVHPVKGNILDTGGNRVWAFPHPETRQILKKLELAQTIDKFKVPNLKDKAFQAEIHRLKKTLILWENTPGKKYMTSHEIMHGNLTYGWKFAEKLDDLMKSSIRLSSSILEGHNLANLDESCVEIEGIDSIFPATLLLPFDKGEDTNDYDWSDLPVEIDEEVRDRFKSKILDFIERIEIQPPRIDSVDLLSLMGSATNYDFDNDIRRPKSALKGHDPSLELERGQFKFNLTSVYKNPHEPRTIVVPTPETLNSLMLLEKQLKLVLDVPSDSFNETNFMWLERWLTGNGHYRYIMSDQKKCGLTFPREILMDLFEVLEDHYPDWDFGLFRTGFTNPIIVKDGEAFSPTRGVGLGMMNGAISAATSIIFEIFREDNQDYKLSGKFYNDDQVIRYKVFNEGRELNIMDDEDIASGWDECMERHGLIISKSKPFVCESGLLLEIYGKNFPIDTMKRTQYVGQLYKALTLKHIHERKEHVAAVYDCLPQEYLELANKVITDIIMETGYEFRPDEVDVPFEAGGWVRHVKEGINMLFDWLDNAGYSYRPYANILLVERPYVGIDRRLKRSLPNLRKLVKNLESFADNELAFDFYQIAKGALCIPSRSYRQVSYMNDIHRRRRLELFNKVPIQFKDDQISVIYWSMMYNSKGVYAPPSSAPLDRIRTRRGEDVTGEFPLSHHDPTRLLCLIQQKCGLSDFDDIWYPFDIPDQYMMLYLLFKKISIEVGFEITLNDYLVIHHLGLDRWNMLLNYSMQQSGDCHLPAIILPCKEITTVLGFNDREELIHIIDELKMVVATSSLPSAYSKENMLCHFVMDIHAERDRRGLPNEVDLGTWKKVEEFLLPSRIDHPLVVALRRPETRIVEPEMPRMPDEFVRLIEQLAREQNAPRQMSYMDYIIMWTIWLLQRLRNIFRAVAW